MLIPTTILTAAAAAAGGELDYVAFTADVTISATTEGTANTVVTGSSVVYDGSTAVTAEFFTPQLTTNGGGSGIAVVMLLDTTVLGISFCQSTELPVVVMVRTTPSAGSHAFVVKAYRTSVNGIIHAGTGGSATNLPGFIRVTR